MPILTLNEKFKSFIALSNLLNWQMNPDWVDISALLGIIHSEVNMMNSDWLVKTNIFSLFKSCISGLWHNVW